jgi:hypothetical protein
MPSATEILRKLPPVFTLLDFLRAAPQSAATASIMLARLARREWIKNAGRRSTVYYNLLVDPAAAENRKLEAVKRLYPSAVVVGPACLHAHGWTTQIPQVTDVAVLDRRSVKPIDGLNVVTRSQAWYAMLAEKKQLLTRGASPFPIESVKPQFALEDAQRHQDVWIPDADDLDIPDDAAVVI